MHFLPEEGELHSPFYPQLGPYSSADPDVVQKHFHDMVRAGISVAVVSWWGRPSVRGTADTQGVNTDSLIPMVLEQAEVADLKVAFHLEPYPGRSAASTAEDVEYLQRQYGHAPALFKACKGVVADGTSTSVLFDVSCPEPLPVLFVYDSYHISADDWAALLTSGGSASLRGGDHDAIFIGLWLDRGHGPDLVRGGFDGAYTYFASTGFSFGSTPRHWASMNSLMRRHGALFVPCVGPGYDDSRIRPWNRHNTKNRGDGEYYDSMWNAALSMTPMPAGVGITSWNEWGEGTQIEPAVPAQVSRALRGCRRSNQTHAHPPLRLQVPQGAGLSLEIRKALSLSTEYADYGEGGPEKYLDATLGWARQLHSARLEAHQSKCSRLATQFSEVKAQGYYQ